MKHWNSVSLYRAVSSPAELPVMLVVQLQGPCRSLSTWIPPCWQPVGIREFGVGIISILMLPPGLQNCEGVAPSPVPPGTALLPLQGLACYCVNGICNRVEHTVAASVDCLQLCPLHCFHIVEVVQMHLTLPHCCLENPAVQAHRAECRKVLNMPARC